LRAIPRNKILQSAVFVIEETQSWKGTLWTEIAKNVCLSWAEAKSLL
jgi:hypothetical protein